MLRWNGAPDASGISRYDWSIWTRPSPSRYVKAANGSTTDTQAPIPAALSDNVVYYWQVREIDGAGNPGLYSNLGAVSFRLVPCVG